MVDSKSNNSESNTTDLQLLAYHKAACKQKEHENDKLKERLGLLQKEREAIIDSFSFKLGSFLTLPIRFILEIFKPKKKALNPIKATCDTATYSEGFIEINGWALSDSKIIKVEIYLCDKVVNVARLRLYRKDVLKAFPENISSEFSGFALQFRHEKSEEKVKIKVYDDNENHLIIEKIIMPATNSMQINNQYQIMLQNKNTQVEALDLLNKKFEYQPLISIVITTTNNQHKKLNSGIQSIVSQHYSNWQLCIYDNGSSNQSTIDSLKTWEQKDNRVQVVYGQLKKDTSVCLNSAITISDGEYIVLLPVEDELSSDALLHIVHALNKGEKFDLIYSDEDCIDDDLYYSPHFKPDFNLDALLSWNYIGRFVAVSRDVGEKINWFNKGYDSSNIYAFILRVITLSSKIHHVPKVLYHKRKKEINRDYINKAESLALESYLKSNNIEAEIHPGIFNTSFKIQRKIIQQKTISIIIPFKDEVELLKTCIQSILDKSTYKNYKILLINNQSIEKETLEFCDYLINKFSNISIFDFDEPFNYSRLNNWAVMKANSELILFLNNDIEVISNEWLESMVEHIQRETVAAVGAKLLFADQTIQHAGVVVSSKGAVHNNRYLADEAKGYFDRTNYIQNVSACTAACLLVKKSVFLEVGGFDEKLFEIAYNDVDLCLKMRQLGYLVTYTPYAKLYHFESQSRGLDLEPEKLARFSRELKNYQQKWGEIYKDGDPYLNPNLAQASEKITLNIN